MLHFEVELEVAYELSSRLHYLITLFIYIIFKTQPYIPSRKAVYAVEHVEKKTKHVEKKHSKTKKKMSASE